MRPKLEVEPLSEPRWNKVERGLFERLDAEDDGREEPGSIRPTAKPRKAYLVYGAVAVAAAVVLFVGQGWMGRSSALGVSPARIVTGASESHLTYGDVTVDVAHDSTLVLSGDDEHGVLLVLDRGSVTSEVAPRRGRPAVAVQAGEVLVRVVGTRFRVTRVGEGAQVAVDHGIVAVSAHGATVSVGAGETWPAETAPSAPATPDVEGASGAPGRDVRPGATSTDPRANARWGTRGTSSRVTKPGVAPLTSVFPSPSDDGTDATPLTPFAPRSNASAAPGPRSAQSTAAPEVAMPTQSAQEEFESAAKVESSDPGRALAIYRGLASGSGPWAANGLYAEGRLQAELGNRDAATRILQDYMARYPKGPNAQDARTLLNRL